MKGEESLASFPAIDQEMVRLFVGLLYIHALSFKKENKNKD